MPGPVFQLAYASTRQPDLTDGEIVDGIVLRAMQRNRSLDITGCLWFSDQHFVQVLEGDERRVRDLYAEIEADPRHTNVTLLATTQIEKRDFNRFSMRALDNAPIQEMTELIDRITPNLDVTLPLELSEDDPGETHGFVTRAIKAMAGWIQPSDPTPAT